MRQQKKKKLSPSATTATQPRQQRQQPHQSRLSLFRLLWDMSRQIARASAAVSRTYQDDTSHSTTVRKKTGRRQGGPSGRATRRNHSNGDRGVQPKEVNVGLPAARCVGTPRHSYIRLVFLCIPFQPRTGRWKRTSTYRCTANQKHGGKKPDPSGNEPHDREKIGLKWPPLCS